MEIINNGAIPNDDSGYVRVDRYHQEQTKKLEGLYEEVLKIIDKDASREGVKDTPMRVAKAMQYLTQGYDIDPGDIIRSALFREEYKQMVVVKDIEIFSLCEHHMLPFFGKAHVAYVPDGYVTGLSKIARVVDAFSRRLQLQERMTLEIRDCLNETLMPAGVAVVIEAQHMCMTMRGVQKQNSVTTTSAFKGEFMKSQATREEFMQIISTRLH